MIAAPARNKWGRLQYHPEYHARHGKPWTTGDRRYLIENYGILSVESIALAVERTTGAVLTYAGNLQKQGQMLRKGYPQRNGWGR